MPAVIFAIFVVSTSQFFPLLNIFCLHGCAYARPSPILFFFLLIDPYKGGPCSSEDNCRFKFDLCVDGICKVNPSVQEDASAKTTVSVSANAYDTRTSDNNGCGDTGCLPELTRDSNTMSESRWSCSKNLGNGNCYLEFEFDSPQDVISMNISFHKGDERTRKIKVCWSSVFFGFGSFTHTARLVTYALA